MHKADKYQPFTHPHSEDIMYEWTASPDSPDSNNQIAFFKWIRLGV